MLEAVLRSRLSKGRTRAGRGSVLWKGLRRRSSKGQLEQEGAESWEGCAKKVAEGSDASRKYVARVGLKFEVALAVGV